MSKKCEGCGKAPQVGVSPDDVSLCQACLDMLADEFHKLTPEERRAVLKDQG
jgi:ribosomal protein L28